MTHVPKEGGDWVDQIPPAGTNRGRLPVVILIDERGGEMYGLVRPFVIDRSGAHVPGIDLEKSGERATGCIIGRIELDQLREGTIVLGRKTVIVKPDGIASDDKHKDKDWSN